MTKEKNNPRKGKVIYSLWLTPKEEKLLMRYKSNPAVYGWRFKIELDKINERGDIQKR